MEQLINSCIYYAKKGDHDNIEHHLEKHHETVLRSAQAWTQVIDALKEDPQMHTILLVWLGGLRATLKEEGWTAPTIELVELLVRKADPKQMLGRATVMNHWRTMLKRYAAAMLHGRDYRRGMATLREAITFFRPSEEHLSPVACDYMALALAAENPKAAVKLASAAPIFEINPSQTGVNALDVMLYYHYWGTALVALKRYAEATAAFEEVFSVPANAVSAVMVDAYKMLLLTGLVNNGRPGGLPSNASHSHEKIMKQLVQPYIDLAQAIETGDAAAQDKILQAEAVMFRDDDALGLIRTAQEAMPAQKIKALTRIYVTLSIDQIAEEVKEPADRVEFLLRDMIARRAIDATIDAAARTVSFGNGVPPTLAAVEQRLHEAAALSKRVQDIDDDVVVSHPYVMAKLRAAPDLREQLSQFEAKRKQSRGIAGAVQDAFRGN